MTGRLGRQAIRMQADGIPIHPTSDRRQCDWLSLVVMVFWFGLVAGLGEAAVRAVCYALRAEHLFYNEHFLWMTPVAETNGTAACPTRIYVKTWDDEG